MRYASKKRAKLDRRYAQLRRVFLAEHPFCEIRWDGHCTLIAEEVDHRVNRSVRPDLYLVTEHWQAGCTWCHGQKTRNPAEAKRRGLQLESWEVA